MNKTTAGDHTGPRMNTNTRRNTQKLAQISDDDAAFYIPLGERIKSIRVSRGITQAELAKLLNMNLYRVGHLENGYTKITARELCQIAEVLSTTPGILLESSTTFSEGTKNSCVSPAPSENSTDTVVGLIARIRTLSQDNPDILGSIVQLLEHTISK